MHGRSPIPVAVPVWFFLALSAVLHADYRSTADSSKVSSLTASDSSASVVRGGVVEVPLESSANFRNQVTFEITEPPSRGRIQGIRLTGDHSAVVTYQHDGSDSDQDRFSFRVRSAGRSPSAPAVCTIRVLPLPGKLRLETPVVDFGEIPIGESCSRTVSLSNSGGSELRGSLRLPHGMVAPGGEKFRIAPGESCQIPLEFHPLECGPWKEVLPVVSGGAEQLGEISLSGSGRPRLVVLPSADDSSVRLSNASSGQFKVNFSEPRGWKHPESVTLKPAEVKTVVFLPEYRREGGDQSVGGMKINDGLVTIDHPMPSPPSLQPVVAAKTGSESFSGCTLGDTLEVRFNLSNPMAVPRQVGLEFASVPPGIVPPKSEVSLAPHEMRLFTNDWKPAGTGSNTLMLTLREDDAVSSKVSWNATMSSSAPPADATAERIQAAIPDSSTPASGSSTNGGSLPKKTHSGISDRPIPDFALAVEHPWLGSSRLHVTWSNSLPVADAEVWRLLPRVETADPDTMIRDGRIAIGSLFEPVDQPFHLMGKTGHYTSLTIPNPGAGTHMLRIRLVCGDGDGDFESEFSVEVPPHPSRLLPILSVFLGIAVVFFLRKRRR